MKVKCAFHSGIKVQGFGGRRVTATVYQNVLEDFMSPSAENLYGDADFVFQQDLAPAHAARSTKDWFDAHAITEPTRQT
ncbi:hypothetical protein AOLI_G00147750 [Acnodon oligacanthus]